MKIQQEFRFFSDEPPSISLRRAFLDPFNPESPYFGFIGNRKAVDKLIRLDFEALGRINHCCNDLSVALLGQAGSGKTDLAKRHATANDLPLIEISPKSVKTVHDILLLVAKTLSKTEIPLIESGECNNYILPPINIFIDEVHALSDPIVQGLLKATEPNDGMLSTEKGWIANCRNVHWIIATTDRGKLFDAFDTRFSKVNLNLYTKSEISDIIQFKNPDWIKEVCDLVAHFCGRIPRESLSFAKEMRLERNMDTIATWKQIARKVAEDNDIDEFGMLFKRLAILEALGGGPIAEKRLPIIAGVKQEELDKFILPWLLANTPDQQSMIAVGTRGYYLTKAGIEELDKREISHISQEDLAA